MKQYASKAVSRQLLENFTHFGLLRKPAQRFKR
jgi:hypothetical protein